MEINDWLLVGSTLLSPLIAVQVTQWLDRERKTKEEQRHIFTMLMATRSMVLDPRHVEALNRIDVTFYNVESVRSVWKGYFDFLCDKNYPKETWETRRIELLVDLLAAMAAHLRYKFDKTDVKNAIYFPEGHGVIQEDQTVIRRMLADIVSGKRSFPIWVANLPPGNNKEHATAPQA